MLWNMGEGGAKMGDKFNKSLGQILRETRNKLGLTQEEVAEKMGFKNYQTLSSIEDDSRQIKAYELASLAKIYMRDIAYFLNFNDRVEEELVIWRECRDDGIAKIKEQEFLKYCYNYFELEKKLGLDHSCKLSQLQLKLDDFDFKKIAEMAKGSYREMQLGARPACSLEKILEETYNIKILYLDLGHFGSAASAFGEFGAAILLNASEPLWRRNFDLAHELFHIISWNIFKHEDIHSNQGGKNIVEQWADAFASNILLPEEEVRAEFTKLLEADKIRVIDIVGIARDFVVSTEALLWRLVSLKLIKQSVVEELLIDAEFRELDKFQRQKDWKVAPEISFRYVNLAFKAFQKGLISKGKLAEYLDINRADLRSKLAEYGYKDDGVSYNEELAAA